VVNDAGRLTAEDRHVERIENELGTQMRRHRPADDTPAEHVQDDREKEKARPRRHIGYVSDIASPRFYRCCCAGRGRASFSPLADLLCERTAPELRYLQTKWAALMSYGMTVGLLKDVVPVSDDLSVTAIRKNVERVAQRLDGELGDERSAFVEGAPVDWQQLPDPAGPLVVGIDGAMSTHAIKSAARAGSKSSSVEHPTAGDSKCFGFISRFDPKPKRRLHDMLASQGLQMNQQVVFLSDGSDTVRDLQMRMSPQAEHILDWFHVAMRVTLMRQLAIDLTNAQRHSDAEGETPIGSELIRDLASLKWNLWHGNVRRALEIVDDLSREVASLPHGSGSKPKLVRICACSAATSTRTGPSSRSTAIAGATTRRSHRVSRSRPSIRS